MTALQLKTDSDNLSVISVLCETSCFTTPGVGTSTHLSSVCSMVFNSLGSYMIHWFSLLKSSDLHGNSTGLRTAGLPQLSSYSGAAVVVTMATATTQAAEATPRDRMGVPLTLHSQRQGERQHPGMFLGTISTQWLFCNQENSLEGPRCDRSQSMCRHAG